MNQSQALPLEAEPRFVTTNSGVILDLDKPDPKDINLDDLITGLANNCRFSGQLPVHYSVAAHSIILADLMDDVALQRYALLHDGSEAFIIDLPRPVKKMCPQYKEVEDRIQKAVEIRFGIDGTSEVQRGIVHTMDHIMPAFEQVALKKEPPAWAWSALYEVYGGGEALSEEMHRIIPMVREATMCTREQTVIRFREYMKELFDL